MLDDTRPAVALSFLNDPPGEFGDQPFYEETLTLGAHTARFQCVATIIWKQTSEGWGESPWHASVISSQVPAELQPTSP